MFVKELSLAVSLFKVLSPSFVLNTIIGADCWSEATKKNKIVFPKKSIIENPELANIKFAIKEKEDTYYVNGKCRIQI